MKLSLDDYESAAFRQWNADHMRAAHNDTEPYGGAIGGRITFHVTQTSIGEIVSVKCNACDAKPYLLTDPGSL